MPWHSGISLLPTYAVIIHSLQKVWSFRSLFVAQPLAVPLPPRLYREGNDLRSCCED